MNTIHFVCTCIALSSVFAVAQSTRGPVSTQPNGMPVSQQLHAPVPADFSQMPQVGSSARRRNRAAKEDASGLIAAQASGLNFAATVSYSLSALYANSIAVGDVNADGKPDLVVANDCIASANVFGCIGNGTVVVLLGNGDGTFQTAVTYDSGGLYANSIAVADINGDGKLDVVVANANSVTVLLGKGDGTFQSAVNYASGASSVAIADVNGDGKLDLVVANCCATSDGSGAAGTVGVVLGNGDGTFQTAVTYDSGGSGANSVAVADVNGDGAPDLVVANNCVSPASCATGGVGVLLGNGDGTFQTAVIYDSGGLFAYSVAVADVNADGKPDLVVVNYCTTVDNTGSCQNVAGTVGVLLGNGDGTFQTAVIYDSGGLLAYSVAIADVNGDGKLDLAVAVYCPADGCTAFGQSTVDVLLGNGNGTFQAAVDYSSGGGPADSVAIKDVNGDGKPDLLVANQCAWVGGGGNLWACWDPPGGGRVGVLINGSIDGTTTSLASSLNPSIAGQAVTFTATVTAQPGFYQGLPTGTVSFLDGTTSLGSSALNSGGVAILTISTLAVGTHSVTGAYNGAADFGPSTSAVLTLVVQAAPDFQLGPSSGSSPSQTINAGATASFDLAVSPLNAFTGTVNLSCSITPPVDRAPSCTLSSSSVHISGSGTQTVTVKVGTTAPVTARTAPNLTFSTGPLVCLTITSYRPTTELATAPESQAGFSLHSRQQEKCGRVSHWRYAE